jgi:hypothetical protein
VVALVEGTGAAGGSFRVGGRACEDGEALEERGDCRGLYCGRESFLLWSATAVIVYCNYGEEVLLMIRGPSSTG